MDPVTSALVNSIMSGAATGLAAAAGMAATDAYNGFKALLQRKFGHDSALLKSVQELEQNPDSKARKAVVEEEVAKSGAHCDEELLAAAGKLLELLKGVQPQAAYHAVQTGSGAIAQGHGAMAAGAGGKIYRSDGGEMNIGQGKGSVGKQTNYYGSGSQRRKEEEEE